MPISTLEMMRAAFQAANLAALATKSSDAGMQDVAFAGR
jgi:hypothetical protein